MIDECFESAGDDGVVLRVHVQPGTGRSAMVGKHGDALKVRVAAPPVGGRANEALVALVEATVGTDAKVELVSGESSRMKRLRITGVEVDDVRRLLEEAVEAGSGGPSRGGRPGR